MSLEITALLGAQGILKRGRRDLGIRGWRTQRTGPTKAAKQGSHGLREIEVTKYAACLSLYWVLCIHAVVV